MTRGASKQDLVRSLGARPVLTGAPPWGGRGRPIGPKILELPLTVAEGVAKIRGGRCVSLRTKDIIVRAGGGSYRAVPFEWATARVSR